jgi:hypothetical protein
MHYDRAGRSNQTRRLDLFVTAEKRMAEIRETCQEGEVLTAMIAASDKKKLSGAMKEALEKASERLRGIQATCDEGVMLMAMIDGAVRALGFAEPFPTTFAKEVPSGERSILEFMFPVPVRLITYSVEAECAEAFEVEGAQAGRMHNLIPGFEGSVPARQLTGNLPFNIAAPQVGEVIYAGCPGIVRLHNVSKKVARFRMTVRAFVIDV